MSKITKNDFVVLVRYSPYMYYNSDVFVVTDMKPGFKDVFCCKSLFRDESFEFTRRFIRKVTPSAAKKRIQKKILEHRAEINYLMFSDENI